MNRLLPSFIGVLLLHGVIMFAQSGASNPEPTSNATKGANPLELRSDTKGFDFSQYRKKLLSVVKSKWQELIPEEASVPQMMKGKVSVDFRVLKDGTITNVGYAEHSGNRALDQAAFDSIIHSSPLKPLPAKFECNFVAFRFHFYYNPDPKDLQNSADSGALLPCVTSTIHFGDTEATK